jgi:hypothetical protein
MLSGYCLVKLIEDYTNYGKPIPNDGIVESSQTNTNTNISLPVQHKSNSNISLPVHFQHKSNSNYKRVQYLLNKYFYDESVIILDSVIF